MDARALRTASGGTVPYPFSLGTIGAKSGVHGSRIDVQVWEPAASVPRGYKLAATKAMDRALEYLLKHHVPDDGGEGEHLNRLRMAAERTGS